MSLFEERIEVQLDSFEIFEELDFEGDIKLEEFCNQGRNYIKRFTWCEGVNKSWLAYYLEGIFATNIFEVSSSNPNVDKYIWVLTGDLPPAYVDIKSASYPLEVLSAYIEIMQDWVDNIKEEGNVEECYPVEVEANLYHADMLDYRLKLLREYLENEIEL